MKKSTVIGAIIALSVAGVLICLALVPTTTIEVPSSSSHKFTLDEPMPRVRKILVRTNAVKKIVAMADAELLDQKWLQMQFEIDRPLLNRDWQVDGEGELIVETNDSYLGKHEITLNQSVDIKPDRMHVVNDLAKPVGPIQKYRSTLTLTPDENGKAHIESSLELQIKTTASWFTSSIVEKEIRESAQNSLMQQEKAVRDIVAEHAGELFILPGGDENN